MKTFSATKNFKYSVIVVVVLIAAGLFALLSAPFGLNLFNMDIDFAGGTTFNYAMGKQVDPTMITEIDAIVLEATGAKASSIQSAGDGTEVLIKTLDVPSDMRDSLHAKLLEKFTLTDDSRLDVQNVSPAVGKDMQTSAVKAALMAAFLMLIYITIRFDFKSGVAAVTCLAIDVLIMVSAYIVFQLPFNMNFIAAALTIFGYSINSSIITFDRIRENMHLAKRETIDSVVDRSVRQTLTRNINTTMTTLFTIVMIIILGVPSLRNFAIPITVGIVSGACSSILIAAPLWATMKNKEKRKLAK